VNLIVPSISIWQLTIGYKVGPDNVADDVIFVHPEKNKNKIIFFYVKCTEQTSKLLSSLWQIDLKYMVTCLNNKGWLNRVESRLSFCLCTVTLIDCTV
jgi:hypothetical protein